MKRIASPIANASIRFTFLELGRIRNRELICHTFQNIVRVRQGEQTCGHTVARGRTDRRRSHGTPGAATARPGRCSHGAARPVPSHPRERGQELLPRHRDSSPSPALPCQLLPAGTGSLQRHVLHSLRLQNPPSQWHSPLQGRMSKMLHKH